MSIKLYIQPGGSLSETFENSKPDLQAEGDFKQAVVTSGTWILYSYKDYNDAQGGGKRSNHKILNPGDDEDISAVNGSMYLMPEEVKGFILFKHYFYGGKRKYYLESCADVNSDFPSGTGGGVSSVIILSKNENFMAFTKPNYKGLSAILKASKWHATSDEMGFPNDALQSIRKE